MALAVVQARKLEEEGWAAENLFYVTEMDDSQAYGLEVKEKLVVLDDVART